MRNKAHVHLRCFHAVGHTDAEANMLISLANSTLYISEIKYVLVSSTSFKQHVFIFNYLNMENYGMLPWKQEKSVENKKNKALRKPK